MEEPTWEQFDEIFGLPQALAAEDLAALYTISIELTIALPQNCRQYRELTLLEKVNCYHKLWNHFKKEYKASKGSYTIEYHRNGNPHLHGYLEVNLHPNMYHYDTAHILRMFAKTLFLEMPKSLYKQYTKADVNEYLRRFKSPAVTLNLKEYIHKNWVNYCNKNAAK